MKAIQLTIRHRHQNTLEWLACSARKENGYLITDPKGPATIFFPSMRQAKEVLAKHDFIPVIPEDWRE